MHTAPTQMVEIPSLAAESRHAATQPEIITENRDTLTRQQEQCTVGNANPVKGTLTDDVFASNEPFIETRDIPLEDCGSAGRNFDAIVEHQVRRLGQNVWQRHMSLEIVHEVMNDLQVARFKVL